MALRDWASTAAGLGLASVGLTAFVLSSGGGATAPAEPAAVTTTPTTPATVVETVVVEPPAPDVPGVSPAVNRVLESGGFATAGDAASLGLPPSVVSVLEDAGVVLVIPEEPGR
jgi:hypothetical protein